MAAADEDENAAPSRHHSSIVSPASPQIGVTSCSCRFRATPLPSKSSPSQNAARTPALMAPPETLDTVLMRGSQPSSFNLRRQPAWNSTARYPPPHSDKAMPSLSSSSN